MNKKKIAGIIALIIILAASFVAWNVYANLKKATPSLRKSLAVKKPDLPKFPDFNNDTLASKYIDSIIVSTDKPCPQCAGRKVSISIIGSDARIGSNVIHADANHLVNIWLDSGKIEVISIPRGTFCDAGFDDTTGLNYLANFRANRGRERYLEEIEELSGTKKIDHYVEFGFSQAIGLLKLLGFKDNAAEMLRVLRSRKSFASGDFQRSFNQGQFIAQMIFMLSQLEDNVWTDLVIRGGLAMVETDLTYDQVKQIQQTMKKGKFPRGTQDIICRLKPNLRQYYQQYNFTDKRERDSIFKFIVERSKYIIDENDEVVKPTTDKDFSFNVYRRLMKIANSTAPDTLKRPAQAISRLGRIFEQRAWLQIIDAKQRNEARDKIASILISAYRKVGKTPQAEKVKNQVAVEKEVFEKMK